MHLPQDPHQRRVEVDPEQALATLLLPAHQKLRSALPPHTLMVPGQDALWTTQSRSISFTMSTRLCMPQRWTDKHCTETGTGRLLRDEHAREKRQLELLLRDFSHSRAPVLHGGCLVVCNVLNHVKVSMPAWIAGRLWHLPVTGCKGMVCTLVHTARSCADQLV